jgi:phenylalanine-4-hydroxylase
VGTPSFHPFAIRAEIAESWAAPSRYDLGYDDPPMEGPPSSPGNIVELDRDHPGFRDRVYRRRRNEIAALAMAHVPGAPIPSVEYTPEELGVWKTALENLEPLHARFACDEHLACWGGLGFTKERIPQLGDVSTILRPLTGFSLSPVAGLVTPRVFMSQLAGGVFLATQYMRHHSAPLYTPEPDVIHELVGHAALLSHPDFARVNRRFGDATLVADERTVEALIRVYWYTLEFGVVGPPSALKVVGAGLLSSFGELGRLQSGPELRPFDVERIADTPFDPTNYQGILFVAKDARSLLVELERWLDSIVAAADRG